MAPRFAVDHNFPEPVLECLRDYWPVELVMIPHISRRLVEEDLDDWQVILAVHQEGFGGFITLDFDMLRLPQEMMVVHQTNMTLGAIEAAADDPLRAAGHLLLHLRHIARAYRPQDPQVFRIGEPREIRPLATRNLLGEIANRSGSGTVAEMMRRYRLTQSQLRSRILS